MGNTASTSVATAPIHTPGHVTNHTSSSRNSPALSAFPHEGVPNEECGTAGISAQIAGLLEEGSPRSRITLPRAACSKGESACSTSLPSSEGAMDRTLASPKQQLQRQSSPLPELPTSSFPLVGHVLSAASSTPQAVTRKLSSSMMSRLMQGVGAASNGSPTRTATGTVRFKSIDGVFEEDKQLMHDFPASPETSWGTSVFRMENSSSFAPTSRQESVFRLRFFNFNMANSGSFNSVGELQGPGGRGMFADGLRDPFPDGEPVDAVFVTLVETRLSIGEWVRDSLVRREGKLPLDSILTMNARREGGKRTRSKLRSQMERFAASYNGNLKSMLAFRSERFKEDMQAGLFGRLTERSVAGVPVPNPKKAFMGRSVVQNTHPNGIRLCFVSAHFPVSKVAAALEDESKDPLKAAKVVYAQILRKILKKACKREVCDERTAILVQGDLNSRTVLQDVGVWDVLLDLMADDTMQAAIQHGLPVPPGRFHEVVPHGDARDLPVTYKFREGAAVVKDADSALTIGRVVQHAQRNMAQAPAASDQQPHLASVSNPSQSSGWSSTSKVSMYKKMMADVGKQTLDDWGVLFKEYDFRPFRFPACADRVIYWAPDALGDRLSWEIFHDGYEVNHRQLGSDHRPVTVEAVLRVEKEPVRTSRELIQFDFHSSPTSRARFQQVAEDSDESDGDNSHQGGAAEFEDGVPDEEPGQIGATPSSDLLIPPAPCMGPQEPGILCLGVSGTSNTASEATAQTNAASERGRTLTIMRV